MILFENTNLLNSQILPLGHEDSKNQGLRKYKINLEKK